MRMQLKISDSTTGLSGKDVKKLTLVKHSIPRDFHELARLLENLSGVTERVFGAASPLTSMLSRCVHFLTRSGRTHVSSLHQLVFADTSAPIRVGLFIDRRIQQFLTACASCDHADLVDLELFDFRQARQQLHDGAFVPLCPYLKAKLGGGATGQQPSRTLGNSKGSAGRAGYADNVVLNPTRRAAKISSKDHWQTFVDHTSEAPIPNLCCRYHLNGQCRKGCYYSDTHVPLTPDQKTALGSWISKCRSRMPSVSSGANTTSKKQKVVGNRDQAYPSTQPLAIVDAPTAVLARRGGTSRRGGLPVLSMRGQSKPLGMHR